MPKTLRYTLISLREVLLSSGPFVLLTIALLVLTYWWLDPNPPQKVVLATGPEQSAYDTFGKQYAQALARYGITVELLPSEGSSANLELLRTGRPDEELYIQKAVSLAEQQDLPLVASNEVVFLQPEDFPAHEIRVAIHDGYTLDDKRRPKNYSEQQYLKSEQEMQQLRW